MSTGFEGSRELDVSEVSDGVDDDEDQLLSGKKEGDSKQQEVKRPALRRELTLLSTVALVIGKIIGSGIFITPTRVLQYSGSFGLTLIAWTLGGLISIGGGLGYVELGNLIRSSGGEYAYLKVAYAFGKKRTFFVVFGNMLGFLFTWSYCFFLRPASNAIITLTFGRYLAQAIGGGATPSIWSVKLMAVAAVVFITAVNIYSLKLTALLINVTTIAKVLALFFISILGVWQLIKGDHKHNLTAAFEDTSTCPGEIVLAFYSVLYSYEGWNAIGYTVEENKNVERNLLLGILLGVPCVMICYISVNIAYFAGLSKSEILSSPATALTLAQATIGDTGLVLIPLMVAISTIGSATGGLYAGSRVQYSTARDGSFLEMFSLIHNTFRTPIVALMFQGTVTCILIIVGSIGPLINGLSSVMWLFYGLVFVALLIMRVTKRHEKRPFKVWFIVPVMVILIATCIFLVSVPIILVPYERLYSIIALLLALAGIPLYLFLVWDRWRPDIFNKISAKLTKLFARLLDSSSSQSPSNESVLYIPNNAEQH